MTYKTKLTAMMTEAGLVWRSGRLSWNFYDYRLLEKVGTMITLGKLVNRGLLIFGYQKSLNDLLD